MANQDDWKRITLRLPLELHDGLREATRKHQRSVNAQIIHLIEEWINDVSAEFSSEKNHVHEDVFTYVARKTEETLIDRIKGMSEKEQEALLLLLKK